MITEAIILAGGMGTRLKSAVPDLPKCMAPVNGKPFIEYVISYFKQQGVNRFIFALGYKSEAFHSFLDEQQGIEYQLSTEDEPLGTGGAILKACGLSTSENLFVTNGDTLYRADLDALSAFHFQHHSECTLCLKPMQQSDRYGMVETNAEGRIISFREKQYYEQGLINGGLYAISRERLLQKRLPEKCSFEKDYLEKYYTGGAIFGMVQDAYFIDIGIPEDYHRAATELQ
ncbi:MAG TPA: nucleotidyltransferase family protein [Chitinophagaceae bacterium]